MSETQSSPYAPPRAAVEDQFSGSAPERPPVVGRAVMLLWIGFALGLLSSLYNLLRPLAVQKAAPLALTLGSAAFGFALSVWIYLAIARGRNWARILYLIFTIFSLVGLAYSLFAMSTYGGVRFLFALAGTALHCYVSCLLLTAPAREWFSAIKERG